MRAEGHRSVFLDFDPENGIPAGRDWEQELYRRLRACQAVIVLCSEHSMASHWCFAEITHAKALGKQVFPVKVEPCTIDPVLTSSQILDLTADREEAYRRLWAGLRAAGLDPADAFDWDGSRPPYPGLLAFQEEDAGIYFGREGEIHDGLAEAPPPPAVRRRPDAARPGLLGERQVVPGPGRPPAPPAPLGRGLDRARPVPSRRGSVPGARRCRSARALAEAGRPRPWRRSPAFSSAAWTALLDLQPRPIFRQTVHPRQTAASRRAAALPGTYPKETGSWRPHSTPSSPRPGAPPARRPGRRRHLRLLRAVLEQPSPAGTRSRPRDQTRPARTCESGSRPHRSGPVSCSTCSRTCVWQPAARGQSAPDRRPARGALRAADDHPARAFLRLLRAALALPEAPLVVLATMRSDSLEELQKDPDLLDFRFESLSLGPMAPEGVARTIERPAQAAGLDSRGRADRGPGRRGSGRGEPAAPGVHPAGALGALRR